MTVGGAHGSLRPRPPCLPAAPPPPVAAPSTGNPGSPFSTPRPPVFTPPAPSFLSPFPTSTLPPLRPPESVGSDASFLLLPPRCGTVLLLLLLQGPVARLLRSWGLHWEHPLPLLLLLLLQLLLLPTTNTSINKNSRHSSRNSSRRSSSRKKRGGGGEVLHHLDTAKGERRSRWSQRPLCTTRGLHTGTHPGLHDADRPGHTARVAGRHCCTRRLPLPTCCCCSWWWWWRRLVVVVAGGAYCCQNTGLSPILTAVGPPVEEGGALLAAVGASSQPAGRRVGRAASLLLEAP